VPPFAAPGSTYDGDSVLAGDLVTPGEATLVHSLEWMERRESLIKSSIKGRKSISPCF
jgi:hypothetical protein